MNQRNIDALVAEKVMGLKVLDSFKQGRQEVEKGGGYLDLGMGWWCYVVPRYSTNIAAAWEVVEKFPHDDVMLGPATDGTTGAKEWCASFDGPESIAYAATMPLAICLAALKARGVLIG